MQFMPATWRAYGLGGDVHDPRDAILGAANYLRASGAARDLRARALALQPLVSATSTPSSTFAAQMRRDQRVFFAVPRLAGLREDAGRAAPDHRPVTQNRLAESAAGGAPMCTRPSFVITRPRGVRWRKPSWSRYGS